MTDLDLTKLRETAEAATDGPWEVGMTTFGDPNEGPTHSCVREAGSHWFDHIAASEGCAEADLNMAHIAAFDPPTVIALIDEVERLRASLNEARRRLSNTDWSRQAEDRNRGALLHIESALNGTARPLAFVESERDEARAALKHDREVAAKAWDEGNSHGYKDAQGYHAHGDGCGPDFWDCDCENPYGGDSDE